MVNNEPGITLPQKKVYLKKCPDFKMFRIIKDIIEDLFVSENVKIYIIKDVLIKIYKDYEITTGIKDIPYFEKAELRICKIVIDNKVDYYYRKLKRFENNKF